MMILYYKICSNTAPVKLSGSENYYYFGDWLQKLEIALGSIRMSFDIDTVPKLFFSFPLFNVKNNIKLHDSIDPFINYFYNLQFYVSPLFSICIRVWLINFTWL